MAVDAARAKSLFLAASDIADPAERAAYLDRECGGDAELRVRVEALLRANDDDPLPVAGGATVGSADGQPKTEDYGDPTGRIGSVLGGKYKLIEEIGEGAMGSVFMAQQTEPVKRAVAVKVIKAGMDSKAVLVRFEAERQALAMMDHPNIAKVLDAGTTDGGRPFFVMELVKGTPITRYCDEHKLTPRQRLELFVPVCQAIQHAHQKGIIHRDIKPSNVLVAMYDDRPVPKVIDFGVAKATGQSLTEKTLMTGFGTLVGTPEYMSPEQASLNNLDIDTRSDVYSLGVLLYELLTGTTPVDRKSLGKAALLEILRIVREVEAPRPSAKLSTIDALPSVAAKRGTEPAKLSRLLKGELDWLVLKALEKDRTRRYETANALSRDIQRYLADELVEARPPSVGYRVSKFVRRNRAILGTVTLVSLALMAGTVMALWQAAEARKNAETARKNESDAVTAKTDLENTNEALKQKRDELEITLARGLLRPLARQPGPLTELEVECLWELAGNPGQQTWTRFVQEALRDPMTTRQLKNRAEAALHATVGLDADRRLQVERLLGERLQDQTLPDDLRTHIALIAASLGSLTPSARAQVARTLIELLGKVADPSDVKELAEGLSRLAARMEPIQADRLCSQAAAILSRILDKSTPAAFEPIAHGLAALAGQMEPDEAVHVCSQATAILTRTMNANRSASWVSDAFSKSVTVLSLYIEPEEAAKAGNAILQAMNGWSSEDKKPNALAALAARMNAQDAARICSQAAAILTARMQDPTHGFGRESLLPVWVQGLRATAPYLKPDAASSAVQFLAKEITKAKHRDNEARILASGLAALAPALESEEIAKAAKILVNEITQAKQWHEMEILLLGVDALAPHMESEEAARLYSPAAYSHMVTGSSHLIAGFSAAATRMKPLDASIILLQAMEKAKHPSELLGFAEALSRIAARMEGKEAAHVCSRGAAILGEVMATQDKSGFWLYPRGELAKGISALAPYLEEKDASHVRSQATASVLHALVKMDSGSHLTETLFEGVAALAAHMEPEDAAKAAAIVNRALANSWGSQIRRVMQAHGDSTSLVFHVREMEASAKALAALASRLEPKEAARACAKATETLIDALAKTHVSYGPLLAMVLSDLSERLEPNEAARVCARAATILTDSPSWVSPYALSGLAAHMEPKEAAHICYLAAANHFKVMALGNLQAMGLSNSLSATLTQLDPRERARRSVAVGSAVALMAGTGHALPTPVVLGITRERFPNRLSPQELVDLLKHPTCLGPARRIILDQLEGHYKHAFADQWDFVDYVHQQNLPLDLTTPPTRSGMLR